MSKTYTKEYRDEAVKLSGEIGRENAAERLGIPLGTLDTWRKKERMGKKKTENAEKAEGRAKVRELEARIKELERENARIEKENEFLEDAARFFVASRQK